MKPTIFPVIAIDLKQVGEHRLRVPSANRLWMPSTVMLPSGGGFAAVAQAPESVLAIRVGNAGQPPLPFGQAEGLVNFYAGDFDDIWVTVFATDGNMNPGTAYLYAGRDVTLGYGNASLLQPIVRG